MCDENKTKSELLAELQVLRAELATTRQYQEQYQVLSQYIWDYAYAYRVEADGSRHHEWTTGSFKRVTGFDPAGRFQIYHPDDLEQAKSDVDAALQGNKISNEYRIIHASGDLRWLLIHRMPVWDEQEKRVTRYYGIAQDITEKKLAEEALRHNEKLFRAIVEDQTDFIVRWQPDFTISFVNGAYSRYLGIPMAQLIGTPFLAYVIDADRPTVLKNLLALSTTNPTTNNIYSIELPDKRLVSLEWTDRAIFDDNGNILGYQSVGRDITNRIAAERQRVELILQREKVQVLEELISDISHDIKTPIANMHTYLYLLRKADNPAKQAQYHEIVESQLSRLTRLVDDILTVSKLDVQRELRLQLIHIQPLIKEVINTYQPLFERKQIDYQLEFATDLPRITVDTTALSRAVANLIENAVHYTEAGGSVRVNTYIDKQQLLIEVQDTGMGISAEDVPHIFGRFYRADKARNADTGGTGLGLAIVKKIVEAHQGTITVQSAVGKGTTFCIALPLDKAAI